MRNILKIEQKNTNLFSSDIRKNSILFFVSDLLNQVLRNESQNQNIFYEITNFLYELQTENFSLIWFLFSSY
jgi:DNA repair protein RecO (recombination protein O)